METLEMPRIGHRDDAINLIDELLGRFTLLNNHTSLLLDEWEVKDTAAILECLRDAIIRNAF